MKINNTIFLTVFIGVMLLAGATFQQRTPAATVDAVEAAQANLPPLQWSISTIGADFRKVDTVSATSGWGLTFEGQLYRLNGGAWEIAPPVNDAVFEDLDVVSSSDGWAVGRRPSVTDKNREGAIWRLSGSQWQLQSIPAVGDLDLVDMASTSVGFASGEKVTLRYNGSGWQIAASGNSVPELYDISAVSATALWGVGPTGIYFFNGSNWQLIDPDSNLYALDMTASFGWAVGHSGEIRRYNGSAWETAVTPTTNELIDVAIVSATDVWAAGTGGTILHYTGGATNNWQAVSSGTTEILVTLSIPTANAGWSGGLDSALLEYNGSNWVTRNQEVKPEALTSDILLGVDVLSNGNVWATGGDLDNDSIILKREGGNWQIDTTNPATKTLNDIDLISDTEGWAVGGNFDGNGGVILKRSGGAWQIDATNPTTRTLTGVDIVTASEVWASGGDFKNRQGGTNLAAIIQYNGANWQANTVPVDAGVLYDLDMFNASTGFAVGEKNTILKYNGAGGWTKETLNTSGATYALAAVQMVSASEAWAVGVSENSGSSDTGLILHYQGGAWTPVAVSNSLLESTELLDISMISANEGWVVGENGVILYYGNGNWQEVTEFESLTLLGVQMGNSDTGWIVGAGGAILQAQEIRSVAYLPLIRRDPTPTPTLVPTPTPTAPPLPAILYSHNFSNGSDGWPKGSSRGEAGGDCDSRHENNRYILDVDFDSRYRCVRPAPEKANYQYGVFETEAQRVSGSNEVDYGIYINGSGGGEYYLFSVSPNNPCGWSFVKREDSHDDLKRYGDCNNINSGTNILRIEHTRDGDDDVFDFFINDQKVGDYREPHHRALRGEGTGVYAEARDNDDAEIRYSYFEVLSPP